MSALRAVLLDIEGTTTPLEFVTGTLFPFARVRIARFLAAHATEPEISEDLLALRAEHAHDTTAPAWKDAQEYLLWLMDQDRKSTALKALQGRIWEAGFRSGELVGPVYPDVEPALRRWQADGREVVIFSSGSVLAQRLLFGHSSAGDLLPYLTAFFDTTTGPKREAESYRRIAAARARAPQEWLFLSDVAEELDAARAAGMDTALVVRPGSVEPRGSGHRVVRSFEGL